MKNILYTEYYMNALFTLYQLEKKFKESGNDSELSKVKKAINYRRKHKLG